MRKLIIAVLILYVSLSAVSYIETPRYRIHFPPGYELTAVKIAGKAELLHDVICSMLKTQFNEKTQIWINPDSRMVNAYSTGIPVNLIVIYPNPPWQQWSLAGFGDNWLDQILIHEMTHNIHLNRKKGWKGAVAKIVGPLFMEFWKNPDPWNQEGFAVWSESTLSGLTGRINMPLFKSLAQMQANTGEFPTVYDVNKEPGLWPLGNSYYLYGSLFVEYLELRWGREKLADFINRSTGLFPLFKDIPFKRIYGQWPPAIWEDFKTAYAALPVPAQSKSVLLPIADRNLQPSSFLVQAGRVYSVHVSAEEPASIRVHSLSNGALLIKHRLNGKYSDVDFVSSMGGEKFLMLASTLEGTRNEQRDLYIWDTRRMKRLTRIGTLIKAYRDAVTGRYMVMCRENERIVFSILNPQGELINSRYEDFADADVTDFAVSPTGDAVAFVISQSNRQDLWHSFYRFDLESGSEAEFRKPLSLAKAVRLTWDGNEKRTPQFTPDGRLVYVTSVSNIHQVMSLSAAGLEQLSREPWGAWYPVNDGGQLYYYTLQFGGYAISSVPLAASAGGIVHPNGDGFRGVSVSETKLNAHKSSRLTGMVPYFRYPTVSGGYESSEGKTIFNISAGVNMGGINIFNDLNYTLGYLWNLRAKSHSVSFSLGRVFPRFTGSFGAGGEWVGTNHDASWGGGIGMEVPLRFEHAAGSWGVSYQAEDQTNVRYSGFTGGIFAGNAEWVRRSTFPVHGSDIFASAGLQTPWLGSQLNIYWLQTDMHFYRRLASRVNFHTRLAGGISGDLKKGENDGGFNHFRLSSSRELNRTGLRQVELLTIGGGKDLINHFTGDTLSVRTAGADFNGVQFRQALLFSTDVFFDIFRFYSVVRFFPWFMFQNISANLSYETLYFRRSYSHTIHGPLLAFDFRFSSNFKINLGAGYYMHRGYGYGYKNSTALHDGWTWSVNFVLQ